MRGSLSTLTSALLIFMILTPVITYISIELRRAPTQLAKINYEILNQISNSAKDVEVVYGGDGLYVRSNNPPVKVVSALALTTSGINTLLGSTTINNNYEKILPKEVVDPLILNNSYILIILEGGKYFVIDDGIIKNVNQTAPDYMRSINIQYLNSSNYLRPLIYVGILKNLNSFMNNPVPGLPYDPEANYLPVGYAFITGNSHTVSKGDWYIYSDPRSDPSKVGSVFGSGSTTVTYMGMGYYRLDSQHSAYVKWYESVSGSSSGWYISYETLMSGVAGLWAYPMVVSCNRTLDLVFEVKNLGGWVSLHLKPVIYVVSPEDYVKGLPIMPYQTNPTLEAPIRYSVIRPIYTWEGSTQSASLPPNSTTTLSLTLNAGQILNSLKMGEALFLVGFRFASTNSLSLRLTSFILNYEIPVMISGSEVGKYVFLPATTAAVPEVISPDGSRLTLYRPSNLASSTLDSLTFFTPLTNGTYVIRYKLGSYGSLPQMIAWVNLTNTSSPVVEYLRNQHLGGWSHVVNDLITLEPNNAVLRDYEYFTAGSESWYSGDLVTIRNVPTAGTYNFSYYVTASLQGVTTLNLGQNTTFDLRYCWSSCTNYWRIHVNFIPDTQGYRMRVSGDVLYPSGAYYLRFGVDIPLSNTQVTTNPSLSGVKYTYKSGNTVYVVYLATQFAELTRLNNGFLVFAD
ncbi:MAG: hypothetical protein QXZ63_07880 [Sulfolobales archaeon]